MTYEPIHFTAGTCFPSDDDPVYCRIPDAPLLVLKFGSSVLRTAADLPRVVGEIYRLRRAGKRLIVVVSALAGETDMLFGLASEAGGAGDEEGVADVVSLGEEKTAALLKLACGRLGLDARVLRPEELSIRTTGGGVEADPASIDLPALSRLSARHDLLIMPGFVGIDDDGARALLGRGGSDFTAIFIGGEIGAECVRLYKDVDGVFDHDPADGIVARKYDEVSWADCLEVARPLLQPKSMEYARDKGVRLEVEAIGSSAPTRVGPITRPPRPRDEDSCLRVAIAGFGTVGQALLTRLSDEPRFEIVSILARDPDKLREPHTPALLTTSIDRFLGVEADILIEVTSDIAAARGLCHHFLAQGRHVVTASKRLVARHFDELLAVTTGDRRLLQSATVGGGTPALETAKLARDKGEIGELRAVLNGTVNFVLGELAAGADFDEAVANARHAGFAEADPSDDLSGRDVEAKLRILAARGFAPFDRLDLQIEPLDDALAGRIRASGERWIQLATLVREGRSISGGVRFIPARLAPDLPPLSGERNVLKVSIDDGRSWVASGRGAGGVPTAEAIIADLYDIARSQAQLASPAPVAVTQILRAVA